MSDRSDSISKSCAFCMLPFAQGAKALCCANCNRIYHSHCSMAKCMWPECYGGLTPAAVSLPPAPLLNSAPRIALPIVPVYVIYRPGLRRLPVEVCLLLCLASAVGIIYSPIATTGLSGVLLALLELHRRLFFPFLRVEHYLSEAAQDFTRFAALLRKKEVAALTVLVVIVIGATFTAPLLIAGLTGAAALLLVLDQLHASTTPAVQKTVHLYEVSVAATVKCFRRPFHSPLESMHSMSLAIALSSFPLFHCIVGASVASKDSPYWFQWGVSVLGAGSILLIGRLLSKRPNIRNFFNAMIYLANIVFALAVLAACVYVTNYDQWLAGAVPAWAVILVGIGLAVASWLKLRLEFSAQIDSSNACKIAQYSVCGLIVFVSCLLFLQFGDFMIARGTFISGIHFAIFPWICLVFSRALLEYPVQFFGESVSSGSLVQLVALACLILTSYAVHFGQGFGLILMVPFAGLIALNVMKTHQLNIASRQS